MIAVIIPTYNRAALLLEALESVLAQTLLPNQIIAVDDGSTDDTPSRMQAYASSPRLSSGGPSVLYIRQENAFLAAARNTGVRHLAPGIDALLFLDDDDRLLPDALARLADALKSSPDAPLAYGRPQFIGPDGAVSEASWGLEDFEGPGIYPHLMRRNFICTAGCVLLRRAALEAAGLWHEPLRSAEDWDMWLRLAENGAPFVRVSEPQNPVLEYRVHPESMSRNRSRMLANERIVCERQRDRFPTGSARWQEWETRLRERDRRIAEASRIGVSLDEALLAPRHRFLRQCIERFGIASLYRRVPLSMRLRLRSLLGIDRHS